VEFHFCHRTRFLPGFNRRRRLRFLVLYTVFSSREQDLSPACSSVPVLLGEASAPLLGFRSVISFSHPDVGLPPRLSFAGVLCSVYCRLSRLFDFSTSKLLCCSVWLTRTHFSGLIPLLHTFFGFHRSASSQWCSWPEYPV
jgi:hypothetical protein